MAGALAELGLQRGFVVHGSDGLDEITTTGPTLAFELTAKKIERRCLDPGMFGVLVAKLDDLRGGEVAVNREIALSVLAGEKGPRRDIVLVNASVALVAAGRARDFVEGMALGAASIDSGAARRKLKQLVEFTAG
jgi:anthranilate phosphoribosyltransferase